MRGPFAPIRGRTRVTGRSVTSPLAGEGQGGGEPMHRDGARDIGTQPQRRWPVTPHPYPLPARGRETRLNPLAEIHGSTSP